MKRSGYCAILLVLAVFLVVGCTRQAAAPTPAPAPARAVVPTATAAPAMTLKPEVKPTFTPSPKSAGAPYYQGKTIEIIVGSVPGGGTDTIARITAAFLKKYIPGNPNITVRNKPGGGGAVANNAFFKMARPDGLQLMQDSSGSLNMQLAKMDVVQFDLREYRHIGHIERGPPVVMISRKALPRLTDARAEAVVWGEQEASRTSLSMGLFGREFLGWNIRWILGFGGTGEMELAIRRGEIDMMGTASRFMIERFTKEGVAEPFVQIGFYKQGKFIARRDFPNVPTFAEVLGDRKPSGLPWQAYFGWIGPAWVDKSLVAPPATPANIVAILTDAFASMAKDPAFDKMMRDMVSEEYEVGVGQETTSLIKEILDVPPEAMEYVAGLQRRFGLIK